VSGCDICCDAVWNEVGSLRSWEIVALRRGLVEAQPCTPEGTNSGSLRFSRPCHRARTQIRGRAKARFVIQS